MVLRASPALGGATVVAAALAAGCAGGGPLLHPARTLPRGDVRASAGLSAHVAPGSLSADLRRARGVAAGEGAADAPGSDYAKGALVSASVSPGMAPFVAARVGVGDAFEGGLSYTGRAARVDARRSFDDGPWSLSAGLGVSAALYGRQGGADLPNVDLAALRGYGADLPLLVGWESDAGLYKIWLGPRAGFEHVTVESVRSEPKSVTLGSPPVRLEAMRWHAGGVLGIATGFRHVHVALEAAVSYQVVSGTYDAAEATVRGITLTPGTALWWSF